MLNSKKPVRFDVPDPKLQLPLQFFQGVEGMELPRPMHGGQVKSGTAKLSKA